MARYCKNAEQLNEVRSVVLEEQVVDTVLQQAKVTDKSVSYEEAVTCGSPASSLISSYIRVHKHKPASCWLMSFEA